MLSWNKNRDCLSDFRDLAVRLWPLEAKNKQTSFHHSLLLQKCAPVVTHFHGISWAHGNSSNLGHLATVRAVKFSLLVRTLAVGSLFAEVVFVSVLKPMPWASSRCMDSVILVLKMLHWYFFFFLYMRIYVYVALDLTSSDFCYSTGDVPGWNTQLHFVYMLTHVQLAIHQ